MNLKPYTVYTVATGEISQSGSAPAEQMESIRLGINLGDRLLEQASDPDTDCVRGGAVCPKPRPELEDLYFNSAVNRVRAFRANLLAQSDWAILPDAPTNKPMWRAYRKGLRDITDQPGFPFDINWPVEPK